MKHSVRIALSSVALVGLLACAGGPRLTATTSLIGCPENEIVYTEGPVFSGTWTAECRGHLFHCATHDLDGDGKSTATCKEDLQPVPCKAVACVNAAEPAAPAPAPTPAPSASPRPHW